MTLENEEAEAREQYFTPPAITRAALERLPAMFDMPRIAEPCVGDGWIAQELTRAGFRVDAGDVDICINKDWMRPGLDRISTPLDFFSSTADQVYQLNDAIISNPPWSDAALFVRRALEITPNVAMLLRITFLEPCDKPNKEKSYRVDLLRKLRAVWVCPRVSFIRGKSGTDSVPPAWFVWGFDDYELPPIDFIDNHELQRHEGQLDIFGGTP